jgi:hypothetical protein
VFPDLGQPDESGIAVARLREEGERARFVGLAIGTRGHLDGGG